LPDNIKSLFRHVKVVTPDVLKIAETVLELGQFHKPKDISKKLIIFYQTLACTLDKGNYDWTLRSIKQVLNYSSLKMRDLLNKQRNDPKLEEKDALKKDSQFIILKAVNQIIKPTLRSADIEI